MSLFLNGILQNGKMRLDINSRGLEFCPKTSSKRIPSLERCILCIVKYVMTPEPQFTSGGFFYFSPERQKGDSVELIIIKQVNTRSRLGSNCIACLEKYSRIYLPLPSICLYSSLCGQVSSYRCFFSQWPNS